MEKFAEFLDKKLSTPMAKVAEQRHLRAVRDGIIATLPLIIVGSLFILVGIPPLPQDWELTIWLKANNSVSMLPYRMTMYIMTLYAVWGIGYSLAKSYKLDAVTGGVLSSVAFLLTITPINVDGIGFVLPMANLGGGGMFVGILTSIFAVEMLRFTTITNIRIKMPEQVPASVARAFEALTPTALIVGIIGSITYFAKFDWHAFIGKVMAPLVSAADTLPSVWLLAILQDFFWSFGIHGASVVGSVARPVWLQLLDLNSVAAAAGETLPAIAAEPFFQWFLYVGGSGCTIGLVIALSLFAKSTYGKQIGRAALIPGIFNINEPIVFGAPIVLNPTLIIPFITIPLVTGTLAWIATSIGLVNRVVLLAPWTFPGPIGAYLATGGDIRAAILNIIIIIISVGLYYPFMKMYDKKLLMEERGETLVSESSGSSVNR